MLTAVGDENFKMCLCWLPGDLVLAAFHSQLIFCSISKIYCAHTVYSLILNCLLDTHPPHFFRQNQKNTALTKCDESNFSSSKCGSTWHNSCIRPAIQQALHSTPWLMALQEVPRLLKANRRTSCHCWALGNDPNTSDSAIQIVIGQKMMGYECKNVSKGSDQKVTPFQGELESGYGDWVLSYVSHSSQCLHATKNAWGARGLQRPGNVGMRRIKGSLASHE